MCPVLLSFYAYVYISYCFCNWPSGCWLDMLLNMNWISSSSSIISSSISSSYHLFVGNFKIMYVEQTTNHVSKIHSVVAVLYVQFLLHVMLFRMLNMFCTFTSAFTSVSVRCTIWLFFVLSWFRALPVCSSGTLWVILKWFQLPLLLSVSLMFLHPTCAGFVL